MKVRWVSVSKQFALELKKRKEIKCEAKANIAKVLDKRLNLELFRTVQHYFQFRALHFILCVTHKIFFMG